jgi:Cu/Ag efflux pump CusA
MINRIIEFSARNRLLIFLIVAVGVAGGVWSITHMPLDAIPDLSDTQVIVYSRWDRSPDIMEDQVTYPIVTAMLGAPRVKAVRGYSDFGYSFVYIIFEEGTDIYWARSRTLEYLSSVLPRTPPAWAGCTSMRSSTPPASEAWQNCEALRIGFFAINCARCRASRKWLRWVDSCGSIR